MCTIRPCISISVLIIFCENSGLLKQRTPQFPAYTKLKNCLLVSIVFALAMDASKAQCFHKLQFFRFFVSCKKLFKTNVKLCWNKWRLNLRLLIVTFSEILAVRLVFFSLFFVSSWKCRLFLTLTPAMKISILVFFFYSVWLYIVFFCWQFFWSWLVGDPIKIFQSIYLFFNSVFSLQDFTHSRFHVPSKWFAALPRLLIKKCDFSRIQLSLFILSMIFPRFNSIKIVRLKGCNEVYTIRLKIVGLYFFSELNFFQPYCVNFIPAF